MKEHRDSSNDGTALEPKRSEGLGVVLVISGATLLSLSLVGALSGYSMSAIITAPDLISHCDFCDALPPVLFPLVGATLWSLGAALFPWSRQALLYNFGASALLVVLFVGLALVDAPSHRLVFSVQNGPLYGLVEGETVREEACLSGGQLLPDASRARQNDPAWSHDGRSLAYVQKDGGLWRVHRADVGASVGFRGSPSAALVFPKRHFANQRNPAWSPAGDLAYVETKRVREDETIDEERFGDLMIARRVASGWAEPSPIPGTGKDSRPSWSPDGEWLTFSRLDEAGLPSIWITAYGPEGGPLNPVLLLDSSSIATHDNADPYRVNHARWSPDGKQILFLMHVSSGKSSTALGLINTTKVPIEGEVVGSPLGTKGTAYLVGGPIQPEWHPSGQAVSFAWGVPVAEEEDVGSDHGEAKSVQVLAKSPLDEVLLEPVTSLEDALAGHCNVDAHSWSPYNGRDWEFVAARLFGTR